jgi:hypothetical protein
MKKKGKDDQEKDFESDDELYASYDAYKTLLDAGVSKAEALKRTALTAQIVKDLEAEEAEENDEIKDEFKDVWYSSEDEDDAAEWKEDGPTVAGDEGDWDDAAGLSDDLDSDWDDDKY